MGTSGRLVLACVLLLSLISLGLFSTSKCSSQLLLQDFKQERVDDAGADLLLQQSSATEPPATIADGMADADPAPINSRTGIDFVYYEMLEEAESRSAADFATSHHLGKQGIVIGPTGGKFRHTERALKNGRRIRNILESGSHLRLALMTSQEHADILKACRYEYAKSDNNDTARVPVDVSPGQENIEACSLWQDGQLFDNIVVTPEEAPYPHNDNHTNIEQGSSSYWMKALSGYLHAPYTESLFLDSDAYPCPGVETLFELIRPADSRRWQTPSTRESNLVVGLDQYPFGDPRLRDYFIPGTPSDDDEDGSMRYAQLLDEFHHFAERNTGTVLWNFASPVTHTLAHFIPLVSSHVYCNVATPDNKVVNDQTPFRVALFLFHKLMAERSRDLATANLFHENQIPMHTSCRAYPGWELAGTDGLINGMLPITDHNATENSARHCTECSCTPCLVTHFSSLWEAKINGQYGWEADFDLLATKPKAREQQK